MDSITSPKVKITNGERVGARSLVHSTLGVEGRVGAPRWDLDEWQAIHLFTQTSTNQTTSCLVHNWSTFGAWTNHEQTRTHKIHHSLDLGEATIFPLIVFYVLHHRDNTQMSFCPETPEIPKIGTLLTLEAHNFVCRPPIEVSSKEKL